MRLSPADGTPLHPRQHGADGAAARAGDPACISPTRRMISGRRPRKNWPAIGLPPPFWAFAWAGGQGLARYVLDHPGTVRGQARARFRHRLRAGRASPPRRPAPRRSLLPTSTRSARAAVRLNAAANGVALDFYGDDLIGSDDGWDVVLAGDVFYDKPLAERLSPWFEALAARGADVLVGDPGRSYLPQERLQAAGRLPGAGHPGAGGCRGQAHHGLALRLTRPDGRAFTRAALIAERGDAMDFAGHEPSRRRHRGGRRLRLRRGSTTRRSASPGRLPPASTRPP